MNKRLFALASTVTVAFLAAGCVDDPTEGLRGSIASVTASLSYVEIAVGDSVVLSAKSLDAQGNSLGSLPQITSANTSIAAVSVNELTSGKPEPQTNFAIIARGFGTTTVTATDGDQSANITVVGLPATVEITGAPAGPQPGVSSLGSGASVQLTATPLDVNGAAVSGLIVTWSDDGSGALVDSTGLVAGQAPGLGLVTATVDLGDSTINGIFNSSDLSVDASFVIVPGVFDGTVSNGVRGDLLVITPGSVPFDGDELVTAFDDVTSAFGQVSNTTFLAQALGVGTHTITITNIGPSQLAQIGTFDLTGNAAIPANPDRTAPTPVPTTLPQGYLVWLTAATPDDYHSIDNTTGADLDITVTQAWAGGADVDIIARDCTTFALKGFAASLANPEIFSATIPAGECWFFNSNLYSGADNDVAVVFTP